MCLAVPARVVAINPDGMGVVELGGVRRDISLDLVDGVGVGDYVIVHVGYALQRMDAHEAEETLALIDEVARRAGEVRPR